AWLAGEPVPKISEVRPLTTDGHAEIGGLVSDGTRIYFVTRKGSHWGLAQVAASGGDPAAVPTPFLNIGLLGASPDFSRLLIAEVTGDDTDLPIWLLPVPSGPPQRLGQVMARAAAWSPDGKDIAYAYRSDLFLISP